MADKYVKTSEVADKYFDGDGKEGSYKESTGGGHPFEKGNTNTRTTRENGKIREAENDTDQPRTKDGKFTYNAVNGKETKYGGRGETVPPTLTGGKNGVYIDEKFDKDGNKKMNAKEFYADKAFKPAEAGTKYAFNGKVVELKYSQFQIAQAYGKLKEVKIGEDWEEIDYKGKKAYIQKDNLRKAISLIDEDKNGFIALAMTNTQKGRPSKEVSESKEASKHQKDELFSAEGGSDFGRERGINGRLEAIKERISTFQGSESAKREFISDLRKEKDISEEDIKYIEDLNRKDFNDLYLEVQKEKFKSEVSDEKNKYKEVLNERKKAEKEEGKKYQKNDKEKNEVLKNLYGIDTKEEEA